MMTGHLKKKKITVMIGQFFLGKNIVMTGHFIFF